MAKFYYYVPSIQTTWDEVNDRPLECKDELDAIDQIKDLEDIKRIPASWKIFVEKTPGDYLEVNRRSIGRKRTEAKQRG